LPEVAFIETSRQIGYISGCFTENEGKKLDTSKLLQSEKLKDAYSDVRSHLLEQVWKDWNFPMKK
jgi:hypothetical protein